MISVFVFLRIEFMFGSDVYDRKKQVIVKDFMCKGIGIQVIRIGICFLILMMNQGGMVKEVFLDEGKYCLWFWKWKIIVQIILVVLYVEGNENSSV